MRLVRYTVARGTMDAAGDGDAREVAKSGANDSDASLREVLDDTTGSYLLDAAGSDPVVASRLDAQRR